MKKYVKSNSDNLAKQIALQTLNEIKKLYEADDSGLLEGGMYSDFMKELDEQIKNINYIND